MKTPIIISSVFAVTAATVILFPTVQNAFAKRDSTPVHEPAPKQISQQTSEPIEASIINIAKHQPKIEVVFVLDTTGSMSGLIEAAKEKIWSIASTMASANNAPDIKMGLVAYRDRGDAYITKTVALSNDLDSMYSKLMDFEANGGGDGPESVNQALHDAVHKMQWSQDQSTYKVVFLIGDAPAHMDYQDDVKYPVTIAIAQKRGIVINAIQSGNSSAATTNWLRIANLGQGKFFQVGNDGNAVAIATPFDKKLATLSAKLDDTRVYYGNKITKLKQQSKVAASRKLHRESSEKSLARRATYNISKSGKNNFLGEGELVEAFSSGKTNISSIENSQLPNEMQVMSETAKQDYVVGKAIARKALRQKIEVLAEQRNEFLKKEVAKVGADKDSFDAQIFDAIQTQSKSKGLEYKQTSAKY